MMRTQILTLLAFTMILAPSASFADGKVRLNYVIFENRHSTQKDGTYPYNVQLLLYTKDAKGEVENYRVMGCRRMIGEHEGVTTWIDKGFKDAPTDHGLEYTWNCEGNGESNKYINRETGDLSLTGQRDETGADTTDLSQMTLLIPKGAAAEQVLYQTIEMSTGPSDAKIDSASQHLIYDRVRSGEADFDPQYGDTDLDKKPMELIPDDC